MPVPVLLRRLRPLSAPTPPTDPKLHAYLDDLLRTRGRRLLATTDLDQWARAEAMPSEEEIRRLIEGL